MSEKALIECVMLAAGLSSRMGDWKMMLPWGAGTLLDSALRSAFSLCDRVILVTGHRGDELARYYRGQPAITLVHNPDYASGMFSSVKCGAAAVTSRRFFWRWAICQKCRPRFTARYGSMRIMTTAWCQVMSRAAAIRCCSRRRRLRLSATRPPTAA